MAAGSKNPVPKFVNSAQVFLKARVSSRVTDCLGIAHDRAIQSNGGIKDFPAVGAEASPDTDRRNARDLSAKHFQSKISDLLRMSYAALCVEGVCALRSPS